MIHPFPNYRPSASSIINDLKNVNFRRNLFLVELVRDVERHDDAKERELIRAYEDAVQRCITPTDAMLTSGFNFMNVTPNESTASKESESISPASPPHFSPNLYKFK